MKIKLGKKSDKKDTKASKKEAKVEKKTKKTAKPEKSAKKSKEKKAKRAPSSNKVKVAEGASVEKLVIRASKAEAAVKEAEEALQSALKNLIKELPEKTRTVRHPKKGLYTVMQRGKLVFWRPKPMGG
jgi:hypothetical protein